MRFKFAALFGLSTANVSTFFQFLNNYFDIYLLVLLLSLFGCLIPFTQSSISVNASQSGFYGDSGQNRTARYRLSDEVEKLVESYDILDFLGLPKRPRRKYNNLLLRKSAPQFLLEVYKRLQEEENNDEPASTVRSKRDLQYQENFITDDDEKAIAQSSTIMTFLSQNSHIDEVGYESGRHLWFDVGNAPTDSNLIMAGLRVFQNPSQANFSTTVNEFTITVYSIVKIKGHGKELIFLSSLNTTVDYQGWLELNVTDSMNVWLQDPKRNQSIYIRAHAVGKPEREVALDSIGLVHPKAGDEYQTFIVGFLRGPELFDAEKNHSRQKRSTNINSRTTPSKNIGSCQKQPLTVNFEDLGWNDWIIAPKSYEAFQCDGDCNVPLTSKINSNNHAVIQALLHGLNAKVASPCCVPTHLGAISLIYFDDNENVIIKKYRNMFVKSCGCL